MSLPRQERETEEEYRLRLEEEKKAGVKTTKHEDNRTPEDVEHPPKVASHKTHTTHKRA